MVFLEVGKNFSVRKIYNPWHGKFSVIQWEFKNINSIDTWRKNSVGAVKKFWRAVIQFCLARSKNSITTSFSTFVWEISWFKYLKSTRKGCLAGLQFEDVCILRLFDLLYLNWLGNPKNLVWKKSRGLKQSKIDLFLVNLTKKGFFAYF